MNAHPGDLHGPAPERDGLAAPLGRAVLLAAAGLDLDGGLDAPGVEAQAEHGLAVAHAGLGGVDEGGADNGGADERLRSIREFPVTNAMLQNPDPADWLMYSRTYDAQRFSPLDEINRENVGGLRRAWTKTLPDGPIEIVPLVYRGVMYVPNRGDYIQAFDAATGELLWEYQREFPEGVRGSTNRNMAIFGTTLIDSGGDNMIYAVDARTGKLVQQFDNYVAIDEAPDEMFGKVMSISDDLMWRWFELLSFRPLDEVAKLKADANPRDAKFELGEELVARFHGPAAGRAARDAFVRRFSEGRLPDEIPNVTVTGAPLKLANLLKAAGLTASTSEALRLVAQGAVRIDGERLESANLEFGTDTEFVVQVGKRRIARVKVCE